MNHKNNKTYQYFLSQLNILLIYCITLLNLTVTGCSNSNKENNIVSIKANKSGYVQIEHGQLFYQTFGSGTPIIVLHGGPGLDQSYLLPQMTELAKDHEVIFYDQRGSGKSLNTPLNPNYINIERFVEDLEQLRLGLRLKNFILLGHSWGSFLAISYAAKYPEHLSSLILLHSAPIDYQEQKASVNVYLKKIEPIKNEIQALSKYEEFKKLTEQEIIKLYKTAFSVYFYDPKNVNSLNFSMSTTSAQSGFKVKEKISELFWFKSNTKLISALKSLRVPTLIIHGNSDPITTQASQTIKDTIPNSQIIYLDQCGHFSYIEKPKELFIAIRQFLKSKNNVRN